MSMLFLRACLVGAQELYKLCEDSTSPIGSRAAKRFVPNLRSEALSEIIRSYQPSIDERALRERTALLYHQTGGHGGLSAALARRFVELPEALRDARAWDEITRNAARLLAQLRGNEA